MKILLEIDTAPTFLGHGPAAVINNAIAALDRYRASCPKSVVYVVRNDMGVPIGMLDIELATDDLQ